MAAICRSTWGSRWSGSRLSKGARWTWLRLVAATRSLTKPRQATSSSFMSLSVWLTMGLAYNASSAPNRASMAASAASVLAAAHGFREAPGLQGVDLTMGMPAVPS